MDSQWGSYFYKSNLPRCWITLDKETIWDYPKDFLRCPVYPVDGDRGSFTVQQVYPYGGNIPNISALIRDYIDTPKDVVFSKVFKNDHWGLTDILKAADRRFGKERLSLLKESTQSAAVQAIRERRLSKKSKNFYGYDIRCHTLGCRL